MARAMKDSQIPWIGSIPESWHVDKVKYHLRRNEPRNPGNQVVLSVYREYGVIPKESRDDNHNVTSDDTSKYKYVKPGNLVINKMKAWQGSMGVSSYEGIVSPAYFIYEFVDNVVYDKYLHYLFRSCYRDEFRRISGGIREGQWDLSPDLFAVTLFLVPDKQEQISIVRFLDNKCAEIEAFMADVQAQIETLQQYKRSVITEAVTKGLNPVVPMKDSGAAWIDTMPSHWALIPAKYMFHNSDLRRIGDDVLLTSSQKYGIISQTDYMERENAKIVLANKGIEDWKHVEPNDFIISLRSFQGGLEMSEITGCITWHYVVLKASRTIVPKYYKWLFKSQSYITALQRTCNFIRDGQDLRFSNFSQVPLPEPPIEEQQAIASYLDTKCAEIDAIINGKRQQLAVLEEYKKSVIFEYVTGKKEVPVA